MKMVKDTLRSLHNGERLAGTGVILGLSAVLLLLLATVGLTLDYRSQVVNFKRVSYERCLQRQAYDTANRAAVLANANLYDSLLKIASKTPRDPKISVDLQLLQDQQLLAITQARDDERKAFETGTPEGCELFRS